MKTVDELRIPKRITDRRAKAALAVPVALVVVRWRSH